MSSTLHSLAREQSLRRSLMGARFCRALRKKKAKSTLLQYVPTTAEELLLFYGTTYVSSTMQHRQLYEKLQWRAESRTGDVALDQRLECIRRSQLAREILKLPTFFSSSTTERCFFCVP